VVVNNVGASEFRLVGSWRGCVRHYQMGNVLVGDTVMTGGKRRRRGTGRPLTNLVRTLSAVKRSRGPDIGGYSLCPCVPLRRGFEQMGLAFDAETVCARRRRRVAGSPGRLRAAGGERPGDARGPAGRRYTRLVGNTVITGAERRRRCAGRLPAAMAGKSVTSEARQRAQRNQIDAVLPARIAKMILTTYRE
jgi:hypothetical protein